METYIGAFHDGDFAAAAELLPEDYVEGLCGGAERTQGALAASKRDGLASFDYSIEGVRRVVNDPVPRAVFVVQENGRRGVFPVGFAWEDGRWKLAEMHPADASAYCTVLGVASATRSS